MRTQLEIQELKKMAFEVCKVKTKHTINYKGHSIRIEGNHRYSYQLDSKMTFTLWCKVTEGVENGYGYGYDKTRLRECLDALLKRVSESLERKKKTSAFRDLHASLSTEGKIAHPNFAYTRFQNSSLGNYYNIYWRSELSPTGVELVGGCNETEWEVISKETNNTNNYYSPTENR